VSGGGVEGELGDGVADAGPGLGVVARDVEADRAVVVLGSLQVERVLDPVAQADQQGAIHLQNAHAGHQTPDLACALGTLLDERQVPALFGRGHPGGLEVVTEDHLDVVVAPNQEAQSVLDAAVPVDAQLVITGSVLCQERHDALLFSGVVLDDQNVKFSSQHPRTPWLEDGKKISYIRPYVKTKSTCRTLRRRGF